MSETFEFTYINREDRISFMNIMKMNAIISGDYYKIFVLPKIIFIVSEFIISDIASIIDKYLCL